MLWFWIFPLKKWIIFTLITAIYARNKIIGFISDKIFNFSPQSSKKRRKKVVILTPAVAEHCRQPRDGKHGPDSKSEGAKLIMNIPWNSCWSWGNIHFRNRSFIKLLCTVTENYQSMSQHFNCN
jgi:hypothetical protein